MYSVKQAAGKVGISEGLLVLWISTGKFKPSVEASDTSAGLTGIAKLAWESYAGGPNEHALGWNRFMLTDGDVERLRGMVEQTSDTKAKAESSHVKGAHYSVKELASLWGLGVDTVRGLFEDEPDVIKLKNPAKRGKRAYTTLRIPEKVADRVQRRLS